MARRVIFSDLHFGDPHCTLHNRVVSTGLRTFLRGLGPVDELILAGDIVDANISSLTRAVEGRNKSRPWPMQMGFWCWIADILQDGKLDVQRIIYIPGNHDHIIWNILSTNRVFVDRTAKGNTRTNLPLTEGFFPRPLVRGVAPGKVRDRFSVIFPDYEFELSGRSVLVTHGHYLDEHRRKAICNFIGLTQYQAVAKALSCLKGSRQFIKKTYKGITWPIDAIGKLRNKPINMNMLRAIEIYLHYFRNCRPDVFIFGHTHKAGHTNTKVLGSHKANRLIAKDIDVWNNGCFLGIQQGKQAGTFIVTDDNPLAGGAIKLLAVDSKGNVKEKDI